MSRDYLTQQQQQKASTREGSTVEERLAEIVKLIRHSTPQTRTKEKKPGRNLFTRTLDRGFTFLREYLTPLHWLLVGTVATVLYLYVQLVAITSRLSSPGERQWPDVPAPSVIGLWHRTAPSLLVAFAKRRPRSRCVIMIASDPRGDYITMLCRTLGLVVVRSDSDERGWDALLSLGRELAGGACAIMTVDGGGPAGIAKWGTVALASAARVPLIPFYADCQPAIEERHKWDKARNPLPFCSLKIVIGAPRVFEPFNDASSLEEARLWLQQTLDDLGPGPAR